MDGARRTIVLLSAKRSGSTAVFRLFQRHPDVGVCHVDQHVDNWKPNFWNFALEAIGGEPARFRERFGESHPFLGGAAPRDEAEAFAMWDRVLDELGPIVFDKSPKYLLADATLDLIGRYRDRGNDVRMLAIVRDPRDVIASQFELWGDIVPDDSPERRERAWVDAHERLLRRAEPDRIPIVRYEDLVDDPTRVAGAMLDHCGLRRDPACTAHLKPTNIGRHRSSGDERIRNWTPGSRMMSLMERFGYA